MLKIVCWWWQGSERDEILKDVQMSVSCTRLLIHKLQTVHVSIGRISLILSRIALNCNHYIPWFSPLGILAKRLYVLHRVWDVNEYISVVVSQIITKFNERVG